MNIIACTINFRSFQSITFNQKKFTLPCYFSITAFDLARSKGGRLFWKRMHPSPVCLFETKKEAIKFADEQGWLVLKRRTRKYNGRSFHWFKEGDL